MKFNGNFFILREYSDSIGIVEFNPELNATLLTDVIYLPLVRVLGEWSTDSEIDEPLFLDRFITL